jgi:hypothetical protein
MELDAQCDELFNEAPIKFIPRKYSEIDETILQIIENMQITIPIIWIRGNSYLIGSNKVTVLFKNKQLIVKLGGGYQKFEDYVP